MLNTVIVHAFVVERKTPCSYSMYTDFSPTHIWISGLVQLIPFVCWNSGCGFGYGCNCSCYVQVPWTSITIQLRPQNNQRLKPNLLKTSSSLWYVPGERCRINVVSNWYPPRNWHKSASKQLSKLLRKMNTACTFACIDWPIRNMWYKVFALISTYCQSGN